MVIEGLDHVQLAAPRGSEPQLRRFYGEILQLPELPKPPHLAARGGVWFQVGRLQLHIGIDDAFVPAHKAHPALLVSDLDALEQRLRAAGFVPEEDQPLPGYRRFYCSDPAGNRIEFLQPLS